MSSGQGHHWHCSGALCVLPRAEDFQYYVQLLSHAMLWSGACWGGQKDQRTSDGHQQEQAVPHRAIPEKFKCIFRINQLRKGNI